MLSEETRRDGPLAPERQDRLMEQSGPKLGHFEYIS